MRISRFGIAVVIFLLGFSAFVQVISSPLANAFPTITKGVNYNLTDYGNGTYKWVSTPQRIWDVSNNSWVGWKLEDLRSTLGFIQIKNSRIGVSIYPYYAEFWNPNMTEVRVYMEQWQVEALNPTNQKWSSVAMPSPSFQPEVTSIIQNATGVYIYQIYPQNYAGRLTVVYIIKADEPLKHEINYVSLLSIREHKVSQIWSGIVSAKLRRGNTLSTITNLTVFSDFVYSWEKTDGSLVIRENQRNAKGFFKESSIDVDAKGSKATFTFQNASLMTIPNGGSFSIDPTTDTFNPSLDGQVRNTGATYSTVQSAATGDTSDAIDTGLVFSQVDDDPNSPRYYLYRAFLRFDTSSIPDTAIISASKLTLYLTSSVAISVIARIQKWTEASDGLSTADYDGFDGVNYDDGNADVLNWTLNANNDITISTTSLISLTGNTDIALRSSRDVSATTPGASDEYLKVNSVDAAANKPTLSVTYTTVFNLTISTIYANDQTTSLTSGLYLSYQDTTNSTGPTKYAYTGSKTFSNIPVNDVIRLKVQWRNSTSTDGGVLVNGSASIDITITATVTQTLYLSVFKSTVLAFQYSDASTSFPTAKVTSVVVTNTGNTTTLTLTTFSNIGLVRNGTYTISSTNIFGVDVKSTTSFSVTADSSTKTLVANVHQPTLNTRRNDGTAITPTSVVLVAPGNGTSLTISSYSNLVMVEGAYTPSSINFYGEDVKLNATTFTPTAMSGQFTFNTIIYTRTSTFKDSAGAALYTQPTSYKITSVNTTLSSSLTPGSSSIIVGGTSTVSAITWQGTDVTPSSATFDSASGNPDFSLKIYALNVQNTLYPSTTLSTAHSITFPNSTSVEKTPSSGWINMSQVQSGTITLTATITVSSTERYQSYNTSSFTLSANTNRVHHWFHEYSASLTPKGTGGFTPNTAPTTLSFTLLNGTSKSLSPGSATWLLTGVGSVSSVTWRGIEVVASSTSVTIASGTDYTFNTLITKDTDGNFNFAIGGATAISFSSLASNKLTFVATAATGSHTLKLEIISPSYQVQPSKVSVDTTNYLSSTVGWVFSSTLFTVPLTFTSSPTIIVDFTQTSPGANPPSVTTTSTPSKGTSSGDTSSVTFGEPTVWQEYTQETAATTTTTTAIGIVNVTLPVAATNPISALIPEPYATGLLVGLVSSAGVLIILAVKAQQYNKQFSVRMPMRERYQNRFSKPRIPQRAPFLMFFGSVFGILGTLLIVGEPKFQSLFAGLFLPPQSIFNVADGLTSEAYTVAMIFGGIIVVFGVALFSTGLGFYRSLNQRLGIVRR